MPRASFLFRDWPFSPLYFVIGGGREKIFGEGACSGGLNQGVWIAAADLISALATGTHWDITATDQIRPIATVPDRHGSLCHGALLGVRADEAGPRAHGRPPNRFADRLGISRIVFVALDVGLHILRRH